MKMKGAALRKIALIYHIAEEKTWLSGLEVGAYQPLGFARDGFIHCSTREQVLRAANDFYRAHGGLVLLELAVDRLAAEIRWENLEGGEEAFPHVYGPLNLEGVVRVAAFPPEADGTFSFPF